MYAVLKDHAVKNVWCNPEQDNQIHLGATRITRPEGESISFTIMNRRVSFPLKDRRYHVFQIGQAHPVLLGLLPKQPDWAISEWKSFSETVNALYLYADIYTDAGIHIPLHRVHYMYTADRALIFAVDAKSNSPVDYEHDQIYLHLYTNEYYSSVEANHLVYQTATDGMTIGSNVDILTIQAKAAKFKAMVGQTLCFVNGQLVEDLNFTTLKIGDVAAFQYDASVKAVYDFLVSDLQTFTSELDGDSKYLLHPLGKGNQIDYVDDIDIYVLKKTGNRYVGRMIQRNQKKALRMVTHRDYSLSVAIYESIVSRFAEYLSDKPMDLRDFHIRLYVRNSGMIRPLIRDHQRIFELYKLDDAKIMEAMVGVNSVMPYWRASALENSAYTRLMRCNYREIDIGLIEKAYGYNSITQIVGNTPQRVVTEGGVRQVYLPPSYQTTATIYEYDADGVLLGFYPHSYGAYYFPTHAATATIEAVRGKGSHSPSVSVGTDFLPIPVDQSYRVYMCYLVNGEVNNDWRDITGSDLYEIRDNVLYWKNLETDQWLMVRTDENFLAYSVTREAVGGNFFIDLTEIIAGKETLMSIPMLDLDLWLNGKSLVPNLDTFMVFPRIYIVNKEYLLQPAIDSSQTVTVRFTGLTGTDLKTKDPEDYGFVEFGFLSNNHRFDVRDDKVLRITLKGNLKTRSQLKFSEEHTGVSITDASNGWPYQIKDVTIPMVEQTEEETYALRKVSLEVDTAVENYMSMKFPQPQRGTINAVVQRYMLTSPFLSRIITEVSTGNIPLERLQQKLGDADVLEICQPYEGILKFDPLSIENEVDNRYVVIHPTVNTASVPLNLYGYRFVQKVVELYGRGLVSLSPHVVIDLGV